MVGPPMVPPRGRGTGLDCGLRRNDEAGVGVGGAREGW